MRAGPPSSPFSFYDLNGVNNSDAGLTQRLKTKIEKHTTEVARNRATEKPRAPVLTK